MKLKRKFGVVGAVAMCGGFASLANAEPFSDNFDSGNLAAWGPAQYPLGPVSDVLISAQSGALRMQGIGSSSTQAEAIALPLASTTGDPSLYQNGSASVDIDLDGNSNAFLLVRGDLESFSYVGFGIGHRPSSGLNAAYLEVAVNGVLTTEIFEFVSVDFGRVTLNASWNMGEFAFSVTNRDSNDSVNFAASDDSLLGGGEVGLLISRNNAGVFDFGATFDNFSIVPTPGTITLLGIVGLAGVRRRR